MQQFRQTLEHYGPLAARVLLAQVFIVSGFGKLKAFTATASFMSNLGIPASQTMLVLTIALELDAAGDGRFAPWRTFRLQAGERVHEKLPDGLNAYWLRAVSRRDAELTCQLTYE